MRYSHEQDSPAISTVRYCSTIGRSLALCVFIDRVFGVGRHADISFEFAADHLSLLCHTAQSSLALSFLGPEHSPQQLSLTRVMYNGLQANRASLRLCERRFRHFIEIRRFLGPRESCGRVILEEAR